MSVSTPHKQINSCKDRAKVATVETVRKFLNTEEKVDSILDKNTKDLDSFEHSRAEAIVMSFLRNKILIETSLKKLFKKNPKPRVYEILVCTAADILSSDKKKLAKVVHSWVEFSKEYLSKFEVGFVNAIARKIQSSIDSVLSKYYGTELMSIKYNHQTWLVDRWIKEFGFDKAEEILKENSKISAVYFRIDYSEEAKEILRNYTDCFEATKFDNFLKLKSGMWKKAKELLETSHFYIQDPSTFFAPEALNPKLGGKYLDLCASPGGKTKTIADILLKNKSSKKNTSLLVSSDTKKRITQLIENVGKIKGIETSVLECDLLKENLFEKLSEKHLPTLYDGVFVDAPCSNTGVLGRRPDVRYRLESKDITSCAEKQLEILRVAKDFVKVNGKLQYSTCSIEKEENEDNVVKFLKENDNFKLIEQKTIFPSSENDGASYALFERIY